jgi:hypothetical protein
MYAGKIKDVQLVENGCVSVKKIPKLLTTGVLEKKLFNPVAPTQPFFGYITSIQGNRIYNWWKI